MPRYFFSFYDGKAYPDHIGQELPDDEAVRLEAMHCLPAMAKDHIPKEGDKQGYTILVTDQDSKPVYSATLSYAGVWLRCKGDGPNRQKKASRER